jgi:hypothetical protein
MEPVTVETEIPAKAVYVVFEFAGAAAILIGSGLILAVSAPGIDAFFIGSGMAVAGLVGVAIGAIGLRFGLKLW